MTYRLSQASFDKLQGVHPDLVKVCLKAIELTSVDFRITQGVRTLAEQKMIYAQGRTRPGKIVTWTLKSRHIGGFAIDFVAMPDSKNISWDEKYYPFIGEAFKLASRMLNIPIVWGGDFKKNKDYPHVELDKNFYPDKEV